MTSIVVPSSRDDARRTADASARGANDGDSVESSPISDSTTFLMSRNRPGGVVAETPSRYTKTRVVAGSPADRQWTAKRIS